jgi:hypothetical protein
MHAVVSYIRNYLFHPTVFTNTIYDFLRPHFAFFERMVFLERDRNCEYF